MAKEQTKKYEQTMIPLVAAGCPVMSQVVVELASAVGSLSARGCQRSSVGRGKVSTYGRNVP